VAMVTVMMLLFQVLQIGYA